MPTLVVGKAEADEIVALMVLASMAPGHEANGDRLMTRTSLLSQKLLKAFLVDNYLPVAVHEACHQTIFRPLVKYFVQDNAS